MNTAYLLHLGCKKINTASTCMRAGALSAMWLLKPLGNTLVWMGAATQVHPSCVMLEHRTAYDYFMQNPCTSGRKSLMSRAV